MTFELGQDIVNTLELQDRFNELDNYFSEIAPEVAEDDDDYEEYHALKTFIEEYADSIEDFRYGEEMILDSHWVDYVEDLVTEVEALQNHVPSYIVIDWEETALNVQEDYQEVTLAGEVYWTR